MFTDLHAEMAERFGSIASAAGPRKYLIDQGYTLIDETTPADEEDGDVIRRLEWVKPARHKPTSDEISCLEFLSTEFGYTPPKGI